MAFAANAQKTFPNIICVGKNYLKHVKEMGGQDIPTEPVLFMKPWSSIAFKPAKLALPISQTHRVDHELELGVYINKSGSKIQEKDAMGHVGGYFIGIDLSDRDFQNQSKKAGLPWCLAKCQDRFCPISDLFETQVDPYAVELELKVNGKVRQNDLAGKMHFKIDFLISYISQYIALQEGDLILTGTPDGVGPVVPGDRLEAYAKHEGKLLSALQFDVQA